EAVDQADLRALDGGVERALLAAIHAGPGGDDDEPAPGAGGLEMAERGLGEMERAPHRGAAVGVPLIGRGGFERTRSRAMEGVVHDDLESSEGVDGRGHGPLDVGGGADLALDRGGMVAADGGGDRLACLFAPGRDDDVGAGRRQGEGDAAADALAGTGDDRGPTGQVEGRMHSTSMPWAAQARAADFARSRMPS